MTKLSPKRRGLKLYSTPITALINHDQTLARAIDWMRARGWREKLAKSASGQSLYEHTLVELDTFLSLRNLLNDPNHYALTELEQWVMIVALIIHDAGKETEQWQAYIRSNSSTAKHSHISEELYASLLPDLCLALDAPTEIGASVRQIIADCAGIHHNRPGRSDAPIFRAILNPTPARFVTLANLLKAVDHLCSASSLLEASGLAREDEALNRYVRVATHEVIYRGFSTSLLHRAAAAAFGDAGWSPLLYFQEGTLYFADARTSIAEASAEAIHAALKTEIDTALRNDVAGLMVGSPVGNILPKPDLIEFAEAKDYLRSAAQKIGPQSLAKKKLDQRRKIVVKYLALLGGPDESPTDEEVDRLSNRISAAQPEMLVFKFFKAFTDPKKVPEVGAEGAALAKQKYEACFGAGSWALLQSTSTLMAAKDMVQTIEPFYQLPGSAIGEAAERVEFVNSAQRIDGLVNLLAGICEEVFAALEKPSPRAQLAEQMSQSFLVDLISPSADFNVKALAAEQLAHYRVSKPTAGKEGRAGVYSCPICNKPFKSGGGVKASADFLDNPQTHTNRGVAHGQFGYVMVCTACYHERLLRQLLIGADAADIIAIAPRLNLGAFNAGKLLSDIKAWTDAANDIAGVQTGFSLQFTENTAKHLRGLDPFAVSPEDSIALFRYRSGTDAQKKRLRDAVKTLHEEFDNELDSLNTAADREFEDWETAAETMIAGELPQQEFRALRRRILLPGGEIKTVPHTPNIILIPLTREIAASKDESEANKAFRRLFVALVLATVFDSAVSINRNADASGLHRAAGAGHVPAVAAVRSLVGSDWISISESRRWLDAIGAASTLARDANLPPRSGLLQTLLCDPPEKILRRLEANGGAATLQQLAMISQLPGFHNSEWRSI